MSGKDPGEDPDEQQGSRWAVGILTRGEDPDE